MNAPLPGLARSELPDRVLGRIGSRRRAIMDALRAGQGAYIPAADLARAGYGQSDIQAVECTRSLINETRSGIRVVGAPVEILATGRADSLAYAWREEPPAPAVPQAPAALASEDNAEEGAPRIRISLAPLGTYFDGDRVVGRDGTRWERARP